MFKQNPKFICAPNGVDKSLFKPSDQLHSGKIKLLFASRLEASKGIIDVINAFNEIGNENIELYIAGNGTLYDSVKAQESERIHVLGFVDEIRLRKLFDESDIRRSISAVTADIHLLHGNPIMVMENISLMISGTKE